ncbi:uncharacterized protein LOC100901335 [Galendromus occidentalis]|uniref:Uncharacterized protein LOC100901335 n=1 Tax=Galendromus occidentalis TaxID=34638 RepID=A0AAJ7L6U4_9ACAR|nr:uncharacterized protein LOC100901335 [Galendromus occidentalis]
MRKNTTPGWIHVVDHAFALLVSCPLVSLLWWGGFSLTDRYIHQTEQPAGYCFSFVLGSLVLQNAHLVASDLAELTRRCPVTGQILERLASALLIVSVIFQWDGLWSLLDFFMGETKVSCLICWAIGTTVLVMAKVHNNVVSGVPYILRPDSSRSLFEFESRFLIQELQENRLKSFMDHAFSVFVVQPAIVLIWRAAWNVQDYCLFPSDPEFSANVSYLAGTFVTVLQFCLQNFMTNWMEKSSVFERHVIAFIWRQMAVCSSVTLWRGQWVWFSIWMDNIYITSFVTLASAFVLLTLNLGTLSFQLGAVPDTALKSSADCMRFQIGYFSLIWQERSEYRPSKMAAKCSIESESPTSLKDAPQQHVIYEMSGP